YDPYGFESFYTSLEIAKQEAILALSELSLIPPYIRTLIEDLCPGIVGRMSNMVMITPDIANHFNNIPQGFFEENKGNPVLIGNIDVGMHDLSSSAKTPFLTKMMHELTFGAVHEMIEMAN